MKQFKIVFGFELKGLLKRKSLIIATIIMCLAIFTITTIPSIIAQFGDSDLISDIVSNDNDEKEFNIVYENDELAETLSSTLGAATYASQDELKKAVLDKEVEDGFVIHSFNSYTYISYDLTTDSYQQNLFESLLANANQKRLFSQNGIDSNKVYEIMNQPIEKTNITLGKDASTGMMLAFAIIFIMYMLILMYGTNVATSVAREKDSKTMELLITSTKPKTLILGKVAAAGLIGIFQVSILIIVAVVGFIINKGSYPQFILTMITGSMTFDTMIVYILFSVLGYLLYLFIYASLGSLVSKVEDVSSAVAPITFLFVLAYLAASVAMQVPDNSIIKITSFIPFISLFTMPIRYMLTSVSFVSIIVSSIIMIVTVLLFATLSIYIYRFGSLNYGNKIKFKEIVKSLKK